MAIDYCEEKIIRMNDEGPDDLLTPQQAAAYLEKKWDRPFTSKDLNNLRNNRGIKATYEESRITLWRRGDLDQLEAPRYREELHGKQRRKRKSDD